MNRWWKECLSELIKSHCLFLVTDNVRWISSCGQFDSLLREVNGEEGSPQPQEGCDVKAKGDGDLVELSAADASNRDKAKSANSTSLILVYICLPVPAVPPCPQHHDRAKWRRNSINSFTPQPPTPTHSPPTGFHWPHLREGKPEKASVPQLSSRLTPSTPLHLLGVWLPFTPSPYRNSAPVLAPVLQSKLSSTIEP